AAVAASLVGHRGLLQTSGGLTILPSRGRNRCDRDRYTGGMPESTLLVVLLVAILVAIVLLVLLLLRKPDAMLEAHRSRLEQALRDEQRDGRAELRQQLDSLSGQQETRIDGFGRNLAELTARTDQRLDLLREALIDDARKARAEGAELQQRSSDAIGQRLSELTQRNEQRIGEM